MLAVSDDFNDAEQADVAKPVTKAYLVLGDYATPAFGGSASASGAAANYPASGAINGDRTELNVGPAATADNDIGQASWRSAVAPSSTPQTLTVDLGQVRTFNRLKLYHLSSHALLQFKFGYSVAGSVYTDFAGVTGYYAGDNQLVSSGEVDTIDLVDDVTARYIKLTVNSTAVALDYANVVELEVYRLVDISDRLSSCKTSQARDYQLNNAMPSTASLVLDNTDKFFSPSYVPTASQTDFVNSQLKPGIGLLVKFGFDFGGAQEYAQQFIGTIDRFTIKPGARTCSIEARDGMKATFNKIVSTKLKANQDLGAIVTYMLNQANISSWETDVDQTGIVIDWFFTFNEAIIDTMRDLVEGGGDATFYFAEDGTAVFKSYLRSTALSFTDSAEADFEAGSLTAVDSTSVPGKLTMKWFKIDDFTDGDFSANPAWSDVALNGSGGILAKTWAITSGAVDALVTTAEVGFLGSKFLITPFSAVTGTWAWRTKVSVAGANSPHSIFYFMSNAGSPSAVGVMTNSYSVEIIPSAVSRLVKLVGSTRTNLATWTGAPTDDGAFHDVRVTRTAAGVMNVYIDGVLKATATDTTFSTSTLISCAAVNGGFTGGNHVLFDDIYWSPVIEASEAVNSQGTFVSQTIDQETGIATEGVFQTTQLAPTGTAIAWSVQTSADGSTWDPLISISPGDIITSTARRYIRYKAVLSSTAYLVSPTITDVTVNWTIGEGSVKYPSSVSFVFDESLSMDLDQIYADTVGGGTAIINSVSVKAQPLVLSGADTDVQWQGTTGVPPVNVSVSDPLGVTNGQTLTYQIVVDGGIDTTHMSGASPAAAAITFAGGGSGTWVFSSIHPTRPVLVITITGTGTITNLQLVGKTFSSDDTFLEATASDTASIQQFGPRQQDVSNKYIVNSATAQSIADRLVEDLSDAITYTPQVKVRHTFSVQIGDRVTLENTQLNISEDNLVIGVDHWFAATQTGGDVYTMLKLLKIPT